MSSPQPQSGRPQGRPSTLVPREHGVYAEVAFPILTGLWIGHASAGGICFAIAVITAFLLHEPVLVLLGRRGGRVKRELGRRARRQFLILAAIALAASVAGLLHATTPVRIAFIVLVPIAVPLAFMIATKQEKTIAGESFIALVLSIASVPIAMAGGASVRVAGAAALVWTVVFVMSTASVHAILARTKRHTSIPSVVVALLALGTAAGATVAHVRGGPMWLLALVPASLVVFGVLTGRLPIRRLRMLGWLLVAGNLATAIVLIVALS